MSRSLTFILTTLGVIYLTLTGIAFSQPCADTAQFNIGSVDIEPCSLQHRMNIPIYLDNPCPIGGFTAQIILNDSSWAAFDPLDLISADTIGSRVGNWESFGYAITPGAHAKITVTGIANMPGGGNPYLPPGNGLLFTIHPYLTSYDVCAVGQWVSWKRAALSDTSGYYPPPTDTLPGRLTVMPGPCYNNPRGDANCSGELNGIDVVYLVNFLKGRGDPYCCLCSADANNDDDANGIDVTFIVNFLKGRGGEPEPCR